MHKPHAGLELSFDKMHLITGSRTRGNSVQEPKDRELEWHNILELILCGDHKMERFVEGAIHVGLENQSQGLQAFLGRQVLVETSNITLNCVCIIITSMSPPD